MEAVTLETLAGGAAGERFLDALQAVIENIQDINTDHKKKREIKMTVAIEANEEREVGRVVVSVETKLAPQKSVTTTFFMGMKSGEVVVYEQDPKQGHLFDQPGGRPKPVDIKTKEAKG